ncbi:MAG: nucleotidyl transferase AbiEii/AbiGii toxin family protein [Propionibacteriaceae bacterium]|nr:nucleotidyl transferase AbiEii/AbiGii toxin family protein [Propionibacteriaceae bacterium]
MAAKLRFREFAQAAAGEQGAGGLLPVVEKELLHYEILRAMAQTGALGRLVFQGGTALRLCYGAERYSENLDFAGGAGFNPAELAGLPAAIAATIRSRYDVEVAVHEPKTARGANGPRVDSWQIQVATAPGRPDLPRQRVKVEVANVPAHTSAIRPMAVNHRGLPASYQRTLLAVEEPEEILADKLVAFAAAGHIRHRDLWDIPWLRSLPRFDAAAAAAMVARKAADYGIDDFPSLAAKRLTELPAVIRGKAHAAQMRRFLPAATRAATIDDPRFLDNTIRVLTDLYQASTELAPADPPINTTGAGDKDAAKRSAGSPPVAETVHAATRPHPDPASDPVAPRPNARPPAP